jgi:hypothetical protein
MSQTGVRIQADLEQRVHLRHGLCPSIPKVCLKMLAISLLIRILSADACAELKIMQWQPFQIRKELVSYPSKGKAVKLREAVTGQPAKLQSADDVSTHHLQRSLQVRPDAQGSHISELSARAWSGYLRGSGNYMTLSQSGMPVQALFLSDIFRNVPGQDNFLNRLPDKAPAAVKDNGSARYFRLSFFSRDMQYLSRGVSERDASRYSSWEMLLFQPSNMRNQPFLETIGRIFEPRIDLGIAF